MANVVNIKYSDTFFLTNQHLTYCILTFNLVGTSRLNSLINNLSTDVCKSYLHQTFFLLILHYA